MSKPSLISEDARDDFYFKSFLYKAHYIIVGLFIMIPIGGGAIAIIAGKISGSLQLIIGTTAAYLTVIWMIQFSAPNITATFIIWKLERKYKKYFRIIFDEDKIIS